MVATRLLVSEEDPMTRAATDLEDELEDEYEAEFEDEFEDEGELEGEWEQEDEDEAFLPVLGGIANAIGGLLGEEEGELEDEGEFEDEYEFEDEGELEDEDELEDEYEDEYEDEGELEDEAEEFFRGVRRFLKRAAPVFKPLLKKFGPLVATAVGGPAAGAAARLITQQLEGEFEGELEAEFEEMATAPLTPAQALGEYLAAQAAAAESESEAEAMAGVATYLGLSRRDRRDLQRMLPALLRGAATLTRLLHGNRRTRPAVRLVPGIVDGAASTVLRRAAAGRRVTAAHVGRAMGTAASRVLGPGLAGQAVARRHARGLARVRRRGYGRRYGYRRSGRPGGYGRYQPGRYTVRRQPSTNRTVAPQRPVTRPRPGYVRVVTPVRVPGRNGVPARTMRVVSDIRVPRGAVTAGRPTSVAGRRAR
jgi:hypothetical protein